MTTAAGGFSAGPGGESTPPDAQGFMAGLPRTVFALGLVSFFTDLSSEMIVPLLPAFLAGVLGAGAAFLGLIEGVADSAAGVLKVVAGVWSDRTPRRKPFILAGYTISGLARPLIGLATAWPFVLVMRFGDRVGKGLRTSPRDALIADATAASLRGRAYGFHRAMDHAGAVAGPLVAAGLLTLTGFTLRHVFLLAAVPAAIVLIIIMLAVEEPSTRPASRRPPPTPSRAAPGQVDTVSPQFGGDNRQVDTVNQLAGAVSPQAKTISPRAGETRAPGAKEAGFSGLRAGWQDLGGDFKRLLLALLVFTLGNSTDVFLLLRLGGAGFDAAAVAGLWSLHNVVKMIATYVGGRLSDRAGRRALIRAGWLVYAAVYVAFALVASRGWLVVVFLAYGTYFGLTEPVEKAWVADLVPNRLRGAAFGYYHGSIGLAALPASLLFGLVWERWGASMAFLTGAGLALAAVGLLGFVPGPADPSKRTAAAAG